MQSEPSPRPRLRDLGLSIGRYDTGPLNAITDVPGVKVGHSTIIRGDGALKVGVGPVRTGVTAILPNGGNSYMERVVGGAFVLNGAGEMSGLIQVLEWGIIETPILLTNTLAVGSVSQATVRYMVDRYPGIGVEQDVVIPLVGECDDSFLNDIAGDHVELDHVYEALDTASSGPVVEGNVGGGTGMVAFDLKAGIGTASRRLPGSDGAYAIGVLVMANVGRLEDLRVDGFPLGRRLAPRFADISKRQNLYGSIIAVLATDAPLTSHQVERLCKRVGLGIGRCGSFAAHGSGEIVLGFTTANTVPRGGDQRVYKFSVLANRYMDPLYDAAIECTEEAIINALCAAEPMGGINGNFAPALPHEELRAIAQSGWGK